MTTRKVGIADYWEMKARAFKIAFDRKAFARIALLLTIAGCANVHYEQGKTSLNDKELVFGKIVLVRDGEIGTISTFGTPVNIAPLESTKEPLLITEPLEKDGRFYWVLKPGLQLLNIVLHEPTDDIVSLAFDVPNKPGAYYFGDLIMRGEKHFSALGAANVRHVSIRISDNFQEERAELLTRNSGLTMDMIGRLQVSDVSKAKARAAFFRTVLDTAPVCCSRMSEFTFENLAPGKSTSAEIARGQGSFDFATGKSYFRAFKLPAYSAPYAISLHSKVMPSGIPHRFRVFVPAAVLLDSNFHIIETIDPKGLRPIPASIMPPRAAALEQTIAISAANARAKYMVLYTTDNLLERPRLTSVPGVFLIPGGALPSGVPQLTEMEPWPTGNIEISLDAGTS
ncbi:maltose operon periplasmic [Burkholderiales bacterium GJ-E10]|nr:maltose operon periplasmic [Burkholderiales bacterium GJ-E10]